MLKLSNPQMTQIEFPKPTGTKDYLEGLLNMIFV
jgi:hypothetical protein